MMLTAPIVRREKGVQKRGKNIRKKDIKEKGGRCEYQKLQKPSPTTDGSAESPKSSEKKLPKTATEGRKGTGGGLLNSKRSNSGKGHTAEEGKL